MPEQQRKSMRPSRSRRGKALRLLWLRRHRGLTGLVAAVATYPLTVPGGALPGWEFHQTVEWETTGLQRISLPAETLGASRPALEDLRLVGAEGREIPFLIDRPGPAQRVARAPIEQRVFAERDRTRITVRRSGSDRLMGLSLRTPASEFLKAATVEVLEPDGARRLITRDQPVFRVAGGAQQLRIPLPATTNSQLVILLDDRDSRAIPIEGVDLEELEADPPADEPVAVQRQERVETPGETRLILDLGAAHLTLGTLRIETPEPLFTRSVVVMTRQLEGQEIRERELRRETIYRVALGNQITAERLEFPIDATLPAREVVLSIVNGDSPPLEVRSITCGRRPVFLLFEGASAGQAGLFTGNPLVAAPSYDVALLGSSLKSIEPKTPRIRPLERNAGHRPAATLPTVPVTGATLDVRAWAFRKEVQPNDGDVEELELDLEALARSAPGFADLRLMSAGRQVPYLLERTAVQRMLRPQVIEAPDSKRPTTSRWILRLPEVNLPITRLVCQAQPRLFAREMLVYEEIPDERGRRTPRVLGSGSWRQTPERSNRQFTLPLDAAPRGDTVFLETDNGDNPPLILESFQTFYTVSRIVFRRPDSGRLDLYYGNARAPLPNYDLSLVAVQFMAARRFTASLGPQEQLTSTPWTQDLGAGGPGGVFFWGVLIVVVAGLLILIARLLPAVRKSGS